MKLKKIASLMLAGIMAVSMLAACGEGKGNGNSGSSSSEVPTVGGYTQTIYDLTSGSTKSVLKTKNNSALTSAFDEVERVFDAAYINKIVNANDKLYAIDGTTDNGSVQLVNALKGKLGANYAYNFNAGSAQKMETTGATDEDKVYVTLYCIDAGLNETNVNKMVASEVDSLMGNVKSNEVNGDTVDYYLTVDTFTNGTSGNGTTVVMIAIERDTTKI